MATHHRDITFSTTDGVTLKGWFFLAGSDKGPCIIMTPGLTALKEHFVDGFAIAFQNAGFHALLYDNRGFGESGGRRFDADPVKAQDDYLDAFDYVASLSEVDPERIVYWGSSFSGGVAVTAAAIDHRIKACIIQAPFVSGELMMDTGTGFLDGILNDRAKIRAGEEWPHTRLIASTLEEAEAGNAHVVLRDTVAFQYFQDSQAQGGKWENKLTTMSLFRMLRFEPIKYIHRIAPTPFLMVLGDKDVSVLTSHQLQAFELARGIKQLHILKGCGHFGPYRGGSFKENVAVQIEFLKKYV
ncbi:Thiohydrolase [Cladobotryum mycophilum]|uniref:Thiohydrolase n=1 Tax=Cladobotryum mycophilum TaxID=491253 RepID=A0ABR0SI52_9HYPO